MESVGDYEYNTKDLIGHGAFAVVFKGRHKKNHSMVVAIKSITKKNLSKSQNLLGKEIKILKELTELHHENVVALLDCKETPHHVYLVMEYCNGGDLADYLHAKGTLSEDTIRSFLRQLAGAMKALNAKGIVHRDLKPQNILLCHCGSKSNPSPSETKLKIADFGFARFLQDGVMAATLCGSPMYMAPEVIMSLQYDAKADLWSIGTIVFQCLTGKAPFQAQTPQALKQFYEKNANLTPKIPSGTSPELTALLINLLKRNAKDRMDFDEFFNHSFLKKTVKPSSPVPVPNRQRSVSQELPSGRAVSASPGTGKNVAASPPEEYEPCQEIITASGTDLPGFTAGTKELESPSSGEEPEDFVLVPANLPSDNSCDSANGGSNKRRSSEISGISSANMGVSPPKTSPPNNPIGCVAGAYYSNAYKAPQSTSPLSTSPRPTFLPVLSPPSSTGAAPVTEPIPVPSQKEAFQQIQQSLQESPGGTQEPSPSSSPHSPKNNIPRSQPISVQRNISIENAPRPTTDVSSLSPPSVQFTIGTPPATGRRRSSSGGSMGTPPSTWQAVNSSPGRQTPTSSPLRKSGVPPSHVMNQNYFFGPGFLPPILGSPTKTPGEYNAAYANHANYDASGNVNSSPPQFMIPFGTRAKTLPEINGQDMNAGRLPVDPSCGGDSLFRRSGSVGLLSDPLMGLKAAFGTSPVSNQSPPNTQLMPYGVPYICNCDMPALGAPGTGPLFLGSSPTSGGALAFGTSPPNMEGPIMFVAPDLPEETLMEREHNETLAKLNFVLALVDCILELARSKSTPISALTDSMLRKENSVDQLSVVSEGYRRAEQLVLYVRALQMLSSSLSLSRDGLKAGKLQPSTSVKSVVSTMNERYRHCLSMCKLLNTQGLLNTIGTDPSTSNITADRLIYNYAIEMCQSAALDELFGNPQECFRRYQTAQILLHSLAQQVNNDHDRALLNKYKEAVEKRLFVLQQQGYIYAYDT